MKIFIFVIILFLYSCIHWPDDPFPSYHDLNYKNIEFHLYDGTKEKRELGQANIFLTPNSSVEGVLITIYGIYKGELYLKSPGCNIDISTTFDNKKTFKLSDLMDYPKKCTITVVSVTDKIKDKEHGIIEHGTIKTTVIDPPVSPATIYVNGTNYTGQGYYQRSEGSLIMTDSIMIETPSESGSYRISGCNYPAFVSFYLNKKFEIKLNKIYSKNYLEVNDSCDFNISVLPNDFPFPYRGNLSINVYDKSVMLLQKMDYEIESNKLTVKGPEFVLGCIINDSFELKNHCSAKYDKNSIYWIRAVTKNGRKSVYAIKNDQIYWGE